MSRKGSRVWPWCGGAGAHWGRGRETKAAHRDGRPIWPRLAGWGLLPCQFLTRPQQSRSPRQALSGATGHPASHL